MTIKFMIYKERWRTLDDPPEVGGCIAGNEITRVSVRKHNQSLIRIGDAVEKRIAELEAQVAGYERLLDEAYDEYLSGCTADELHDILKAVLEYAPRRNWGKK